MTRSLANAPSPARGRWPRWTRLVQILVLSVSLCTMANVAADSQDDRRVRTGARLLRALLAAELGIEQKAAEGQLPVLVLGVAGKNRDDARLLIAEQEGAAAKVRDLPLHVRADHELPATGPIPAAIFLSAPLNQQRFDALMAYAHRHQVLVFAPFEGDVERGAHAGLAIEAKVKPFVNAQALKTSGITLKPFFLKVVKVQP